ncbi:MAG TPA: hypothetical protein IAA29_00995, partial [Candidatus Paenibacillus intestinavium]|nr:hypothetical protein [Candidatus Paenibacillus intestinavium]
MRKAEAQVYVIGTREPYFPSSFQMQCRICYNALHRYQSPLFELPLKYMFKNRAFRTEQVKRYLRKAEAQVYVIGTREPY